VPERQLATVRRRLEETGEALELLRFGPPGFLQKIKPLEGALKKTESGGVLTPDDLAQLYLFLNACRLTLAYANAHSAPQIQQLLTGLYVDQNLEKAILSVVDEDGILRDDASPALKSIRRQIRLTQQRIRDYLQEMIRGAAYQSFLQDAIITERSGRYVIPVKQENRNEVPGIVHDESASGATVFIEPLAVVQQQNALRGLEQEERREINRIMEQITRQIEPATGDIRRGVEVLTTFDLIMARGRLAYEMNAYLPQVSDDGVVELFKARHPLLGAEVVPIDVALGRNFDLLVITGPNTGGKTVVLKTVGLLTVMAMCGLYIPAREGSRISLFDQIFVDIGDEQSIEQSLSTFSAHMSHLIAILQAANQHSLILLDELGSGTDPVEGAALGQAILERFQSLKVRAIVTTHHSALKNFAYQYEATENACVEFDPVTFKPTYQLTIGRPGQSNALAVSGQLGLDAAIVSRARELLPEQELEMGRVLSALAEREREYAAKLQSLDSEFSALWAGQAALEQDKTRLAEEKERIIVKSRQEAADYVRQIKRDADAALDDIKKMIRAENGAPPKYHELDAARQKMKALTTESYQRVSSTAGGPGLQTGDRVEIPELQQTGEVLSPPNASGEVTVQIGSMRLSLQQDRLIRLEPRPGSPSPAAPERISSVNYLEKVAAISPEIDLRGLRVDDALYTLDQYINDATLAGLDKIYIIHGKGLGAVRRAVRSHLKGLPYIQELREGANDEGGSGVTVVYFR
jgi:DNA mismatch repair protein MutS2